MKRESYDVVCLASMLIHFLKTVGADEEEGVAVLKTAERMLAGQDLPARVAPPSLPSVKLRDWQAVG